MRVRPLTSLASVQAAAIPGLLRFYPALAVADFRSLWLGTLPATLAWQMHTVTVGYVAFLITGSAAALGLVTFAVGMPMLVFALAGGVVADQLPRRRVLMVTQSAHFLNSAALAVLTLAGALQVWHLVVAAAIAGTAFAFNMPARQAYLADLAGPHTRSAIALNSAGMNAMRIVGPAVAGALLALPAIGAGGVFILMSAMYSVVLFTLVRLPERPAENDGEPAARGWRSMLEGLRYVRASPALLALLTLAFVPILIGMPFQSLMPLFASRIYAVGPAGLGSLYSALGVGALTGSIVVAGLLRMPRPGTVQLALGILFGLLLAAFAAAPAYALALPILFGVGLISSAYAGLNGTMVIGNTDRRLYGRVMSVYFVGHSLMPIGSLPMALAADRVGGQAAVGVAGVLVALSVAAVALLYPAYRRIR